MTKLFWNIVYRIKLGKQFNGRVNAARRLGKYAHSVACEGHHTFMMKRDRAVATPGWYERYL